MTPKAELAKLRLAVVGARGRMGERVVEVASATPDFTVAVRVTGPEMPTTEEVNRPRKGSQEESQAALIGDPPTTPFHQHGESQVKSFCRGRQVEELSQVAAEEIDLVLEFTQAAALPGISREVQRLSRPWVSGTTGLGEVEKAALAEAAARVPVLWSPNLSLGVALLQRFLDVAARLLPAGWEMELVETHHSAKADAPSGTALALVERWIGQRGGWMTHGRSGRTGPRPEGEVGLHALRLPDVIGEHRILLGGPGESLELTHRALDRGAFARGALEAARWIVGQPPGLYRLEDWLDDRLR